MERSRGNIPVENLWITGARKCKSSPPGQLRSVVKMKSGVKRAKTVELGVNSDQIKVRSEKGWKGWWAGGCGSGRASSLSSPLFKPLARKVDTI